MIQKIIILQICETISLPVIKCALTYICKIKLRTTSEGTQLPPQPIHMSNDMLLQTVNLTTQNYVANIYT